MILIATPTMRPKAQIAVAMSWRSQCALNQPRQRRAITPRGKRTKNDPTNKIAWMITMVCTEPGWARTLMLPVPEIEGELSEVAWALVMSAKNTPDRYGQNRKYRSSGKAWGLTIALMLIEISALRVRRHELAGSGRPDPGLLCRCEVYRAISWPGRAVVADNVCFHYGVLNVDILYCVSDVENCVWRIMATRKDVSTLLQKETWTMLTLLFSH